MNANVVHVAFGSRTIRALHNARVEAAELFARADGIDGDDSRLDEAISLYERCLVLDPDNALAHTNLGNCIYHRFRDQERAMLLYECAIALSPHQPEAFYNIGYLLIEDGFAARALPYFAEDEARGRSAKEAAVRRRRQTNGLSSRR